MDIKTEEVTDAVIRFRMKISDESMKSQFRSKAVAMAKSASIPGFRKGKVPFKVIQTRYGDEIQNEVLNKMIHDGINPILQERGVTTASEYYIEERSIAETDGAHELTIRVEFIPKLPTPNLLGCKIIVPQVEITETDLDTVIELWKVIFGKWEVVDRAAQEADRLVVDVEELDRDGVVTRLQENQTYRLNSLDISDELKAASLGSFAGDSIEVSAIYSDNSDDYEEFETLDNETNEPIEYENNQFLDDKEQYDSYHEAAEESSEYSFRLFVKRVEKPLGQFKDDFIKLIGAESEEQDDFREIVYGIVENEVDLQLSTSVTNQINTTLLGKHSFSLPKSIMFKHISDRVDSDRNFRKWINDDSGYADGINNNFLTYYGEAYTKIKISLLLEKVKEHYGIESNQKTLKEAVRFKLTNSPEIDPNDSELEYEVEKIIQEDKDRAEMYLHEYLSHKSYDVLLNESEIVEPEMTCMEFLEWLDTPLEGLKEFADINNKNRWESFFGSRLDITESEESVADEKSLSKPSLIVDEYGVPFAR